MEMTAVAVRVTKATLDTRPNTNRTGEFGLARKPVSWGTSGANQKSGGNAATGQSHSRIGAEGQKAAARSPATPRRPMVDTNTTRRARGGPGPPCAAGRGTIPAAARAK